MAESQLPGLPGFDPHNIQPWTVAVVVSMTVLSLVSVALRLISRRIKAQSLWWDDWMIIFSMGWNLVVVGFIFAMHSCGMGKHTDLVDPADVVMMAKWLIVAEILYCWNLFLTKLSLLLMYYRIFRVPYFKRMALTVGGFVMIWAVTISFLFIFICVPVAKVWNPALPGRCINQVGTWIANAASTLLTDIIILLMPVPQVWGLALSKREKIGIIAAFGLGSFVVFCSAYRTSVLFTYTATDPSYTLAPTVGWTEIEMAAGIISANLPTLLPALNVVLRRLGIRGDSRNGSNFFRSTKGDKSSGSRADILSETTGGKNVRESFHRLADESDSEYARAGAATPTESRLRPDAKGYQYTIKTTSRGDEDSSDEIPLHAIRVETDLKFERSVARN